MFFLILIKMKRTIVVFAMNLLLWYVEWELGVAFDIITLYQKKIQF